LTWMGSQVRSLHRPPCKLRKNRAIWAVDALLALASISLNEPRTVPRCPAGLGKLRAKRSRKVPDGPPQKRSPALAANKRRANRKIKKLEAVKGTKSKATPQAVERHFFYITHGQTNLGSVEQVGETYKAIGAGERDLGTFGSLKPAADAVSAIYSQGSCAEPCSEGAS
jgi:hypothetical protein